MSVGWSVSWLVGRSVTHSLKTSKSSIFSTEKWFYPSKRSIHQVIHPFNHSFIHKWHSFIKNVHSKRTHRWPTWPCFENRDAWISFFFFSFLPLFSLSAPLFVWVFRQSRKLRFRMFYLNPPPIPVFFSPQDLRKNQSSITQGVVFWIHNTRFHSGSQSTFFTHVKSRHSCHYSMIHPRISVMPVGSSMHDYIFPRFFLLTDTQLYKRLCTPSVRPSVGNDRVKKWRSECFRYFLCMFVCFGWRLDAPAHPSATILWPRVTCIQWQENWPLSRRAQWMLVSHHG